MTNGQPDLSKDSKISKRITLIANLEYILKESIYHRTHSVNFNPQEKIVVGSLSDRDSKKKIL